MLVLTRKPKEEIRIGNGITITILRVKGQQVRVGIEAPSDVHIVRGELGEKDDESPKAVVEKHHDQETSGSAKKDMQTGKCDLPPQSRLPLDAQDRGAEPVVSSCRISRSKDGNSMLKILLAERQRTKVKIQRGDLGVPTPPL